MNDRTYNDDAMRYDGQTWYAKIDGKEKPMTFAMLSYALWSMATSRQAILSKLELHRDQISIELDKHKDAA